MSNDHRLPKLVFAFNIIWVGAIFYNLDDLEKSADKGGLAYYFGYSAEEKEYMTYYSENNLNANLVVKGIDHETLTLGLIGSDNDVKVKASKVVRDAVEYMGCYSFTIDRPIYYARQRLLPLVLTVTEKKPVIDCSLRKDI